MKAPIREPSSLFNQHLPALRRSAGLGPVLDLACGRGRHAIAAADAGLRVLALDRNPAFLSSLPTSIQPLRFDLEAGLDIPLRPASCGAVMVFRYLHRPIVRAIADCIAPGGLLLYETFTTRQLEFGTGPKSPDFLLEPGELPCLFPTLEVIAFDERIHAHEGTGEATARLAARRPA